MDNKFVSTFLLIFFGTLFVLGAVALLHLRDEISYQKHKSQISEIEEDFRIRTSRPQISEMK